MGRKDFSKYVKAYSLKNAIEHDRAELSKVLPKLFQHGLQKDKIKEILPVIKKEVSRVNRLSNKKRVAEFAKLKKYVKE